MMALHIMPADKWKTQRVKFLERLFVLAHIRNTVAIGGTAYVLFMSLREFHHIFNKKVCLIITLR